MAVPTIVSMLSTSMYNLADTYFVSSINTQSVAAVGISFCMMAVIQAVGFFFGQFQIYGVLYRCLWFIFP